MKLLKLRYKTHNVARSWLASATNIGDDTYSIDVDSTTNYKYFAVLNTNDNYIITRQWSANNKHYLKIWYTDGANLSLLTTDLPQKGITMFKISFSR